MTMKNPPHPGRSIRSACLEPLGLSISEGAKILGVTRQALNNVIAGKSAISPEMAIRLTKAFGSTEETWLRMQLAYDLAAARKDESKIKVRRQLVKNCTCIDVPHEKPTASRPAFSGGPFVERRFVLRVQCCLQFAHRQKLATTKQCQSLAHLDGCRLRVLRFLQS
jgi:addiction module HigA family antidote